MKVWRYLLAADRQAGHNSACRPSTPSIVSQPSDPFLPRPCILAGHGRVVVPVLSSAKQSTLDNGNSGTPTPTTDGGEADGVPKAPMARLVRIRPCQGLCARPARLIPFAHSAPAVLVPPVHP